MVTHRRGASALGCLFSLLIVAVIGYFGANLGAAYWRFYQYQDDMRQEMRFASQRTNDQILARLKASADSLGLPPEASKITLERTAKSIAVEAEYSEAVDIPMFARDIRFNPHAEGTP